jgi:hypothetical protein
LYGFLNSSLQPIEPTQSHQFHRFFIPGVGADAFPYAFLGAFPDAFPDAYFDIFFAQSRACVPRSRSAVGSAEKPAGTPSGLR